MPAVALSQLRTSVLREADLRSGQVDNADLDPLINDGLAELVELMIAAHEGYKYNFGAVVVTVQTGSLPNDFLHAVDVHITEGSAQKWLPPFEFRDRETEQRHSWCVHGDLLWIAPRSKAPGTYFLTYIPQFAALVNDIDIFTCPQRWEMYAILHAAVRLRDMQELSTATLEKRLAAARERIENVARRRKGKRRVRDVRAGAYDWLFGADLDNTVEG